MAEEVAKAWFTDVIVDLEEDNINSPPEQLFYAQWKFQQYDEYYKLIAQHQIGNYFVDFIVDSFQRFVTETNLGPDGLNKLSKDLPSVVVEIDGHWHEKTPEQVEKDKQRERFLVSQEYTVFRFSAREVFSKTEKCVDEVQEFVRKQCKEVWKKYHAGYYAENQKPQA